MLTKKQKLIQTLTNFYDSDEFQSKYTYTGSDLGSFCSSDGTEFRLWAPTADSVILHLFDSSDVCTDHEMTKLAQGVWYYQSPLSLSGTFYTYTITGDGTTRETTDPYARACNANGCRSMVIDLSSTNPRGWEDDHGPVLAQPTDAVIYELHIRDLSSDPSSGISASGKFAGLTETGCKNRSGMATGLDHICELGVTHVHLLPVFDFSSVDETAAAPAFNWGYDPANYNIPEGSYSSNAENGAVRIREFKEMVQALHSRGIGVILDVVYNHTAASEDSSFNKTVPYYYYRMLKDGSFSNGSECGNETASERLMVRSFLVNSVAYWAEEYHIDGFRFDLMGLHDLDTMRAIRKRLDLISPSLLIYGEGWTGGPSPLPENCRAIKQNIRQLPGIAAFNDNLRDALKGNVFLPKDRGFISGRKNLEQEIYFGICGCSCHPQVDLSAVDSADTFWASSPSQCINYVSAHDNLTLWDKLAISNSSLTRKLRMRMNMLAAAVYLTSQGIPFFQAGEEFLRSKPDVSGKGYNENSYNAPDSVNALKWNELTRNRQVYDYYRGLITFRRNHPSLRLRSADKVARHLSFLPNLPANTVGYRIQGRPDGDSLYDICILFNPNRDAVSVPIPDGYWDIYAHDLRAGDVPLDQTTSSHVHMPGISCTILGR